jgi:hypothetical protein
MQPGAHPGYVRSDRRERRSRSRWRRQSLAQWSRSILRRLSHVCLGIFLVGCSSSDKLVGHPIDVLRDKQHGGQRLLAYDALAKSSTLSPSDQEAAVLMLALGMDREKSPLVRATIARSLGEYRHPASIEALLLGCQDKSAMVRAESCVSLGRLGDSSTAEVVLKLAEEDRDRDVRMAAVQALVSLPSEDRDVVLVKSLRDSDVAVAKAASAVLQSEHHVDFGTDYSRWAEYVFSDNSPAKRPVTNVAGQTKSVR